MEIKNKTTKELKDFSKRIDEEIKFREEVGREIDKRKEKKRRERLDGFVDPSYYQKYVDESGCL
jgi:hypothetical protein|tara:strand:- start:889 stop:1080 length:192 start_codon:yes stop_codon:yes gene_type:complete